MTELMIYKSKINFSFCSGIDLRFLCTSWTYINSYVQLVHIMQLQFYAYGAQTTDRLMQIAAQFATGT